jgi:hypothetical protein
MATKKRNPPRSRADLRAVDKAFIHSVMFERGILPIEDPTLDMRVPLRQVTPEEARFIKRKFRKLWRKCMKEKIGTNKIPSPSKAKTSGVEHDQARSENEKVSAARANMITNKLGLGKHVPSRAERLERKRLVYEHLWEKEIVPRLVRFENPERNKPKNDE